jgi:FMN reductase
VFAFFQALTLPVGIYAHDSDFTDYVISNAQLSERIEKAVGKALPIIAGQLAEREHVERALAGDAVAS